MAEESLENVSEQAEKYLNRRQAFDYHDHREDLISWLKNYGSDIDEEKGYSDATVENYSRRLDQFYRWVWEHYDGYTTNITHDHADEFVNHLAKDNVTKRNGDPYATSSKRKMVDAIAALFEWRSHRGDGSVWESEKDFNTSSYSGRDQFTQAERKRLREAALEYGTIPAYSDLSPEERDRWKAYLAQKLEKPKEAVSPEDWKEQNRSWKIPSLVHTTLDGGLRPIEIRRSELSWFREQKGELHIPKEAAAKDRNSGNWEVTLLPRTAKTLSRWKEQRKNKTKYDDSEAIWLNREGNRYNSRSLNDPLFDNLLELAGIERENRDLSWYSFRKSLGTQMAENGGIHQAADQLRHKSIETTRRFYVESTTEAVRDTLHEIG